MDDDGSGGGATSDSPADPDMADVLDDLADLEEAVDSPEEREQVREAMRTARRASRPRPIGRIRDSFGTRDLGEALVGSFVFGMPMIVEGGTNEVGEHIADSVALILATAAFGLLLVLGILWAAEFEKVESDFFLGVVPVRLVGILGVAGTTALVLMTMWGRVDWAQPWTAGSQTLVTAIVMAVGASLGDVIPES
jgi:uncharacterized membrane protein